MTERRSMMFTESLYCKIITLYSRDRINNISNSNRVISHRAGITITTTIMRTKIMRRGLQISLGLLLNLVCL